jgi:serine/threonine protein kinase/Tol biopolymer transport system component
MPDRDLSGASSQDLADLFALALENPAPASAPQQLGEYQLLEKLGAGGMGTVYKARHTELDRFVAIKILRPGQLDHGEAAARFRREIKLAGRLDHPNIVRAHDARCIGDTQFLVMEYVDGLDLETLATQLGTLPVADACELARQAAVGLQCAHEQALVHRDIKPSNLMLSRGGLVKLLDLGLARVHGAVTASQSVTAVGQVMGTPDYIAPEQVSNSHGADIRADLYSLGCTLYRLLAGMPPFSGPRFRDWATKLAAHLEQPLPPVRDLRPDVPAELVAVLTRLTAKDPAERFATPAEVAAALQPFAATADLPRLLRQAEGLSPVDPGDPPAETPRPSIVTAAERPACGWRPSGGRTRRWLGWLGVLIGAGLLGTLAVIGWWQRDSAERVPAQVSGPTINTQLSAVEGTIPAPAHDAWPGWIVMSWTRPGLGKPELWMFRPDGQVRVKITNEPGSVHLHPKFSPDGRWLAFIRGPEPTAPNSLWICRPDGSECRELVAPRGLPERLAAPVWVSNSRLYFLRDPVRGRAGGFQVWSIDREGTTPQPMFRLRDVLGEESGLLTDASPDGRQLALIAPADPVSSASDAFVCDLQGGELHTIWADPEHNRRDARLLWSPDGRWLAWHHNFEAATDSAVIRYGVGLAQLGANGQWQTRLLPPTPQPLTPLAWEPRGRLLCLRVHEPRRRASSATLCCLDVQRETTCDLFELEVTIVQPGQRDLGRLADWAVVPPEFVPRE